MLTLRAAPLILWVELTPPGYEVSAHNLFQVWLFLVLPIVLFFESIRSHPNRLYWACAAVVAGFIVNRLDVSII